jgi:hypothetical protein
VLGNPISYVDPSGLVEVDACTISADNSSCKGTIDVTAPDPRRETTSSSRARRAGNEGADNLTRDEFSQRVVSRVAALTDFQLVADRLLSEIPIDGQEFGDCVEENRFDWGAVTAFTIGNPTANALAGNTGRMGFGGLGPHPTSWQHKLGAQLSKASRNPAYSRAGKFVGRAALVPTVFEGFYDIGAISRCAAAGRRN